MKAANKIKINSYYEHIFMFFCKHSKHCLHINLINISYYKSS